MNRQKKLQEAEEILLLLSAVRCWHSLADTSGPEDLEATCGFRISVLPVQRQ